MVEAVNLIEKVSFDSVNESSIVEIEKVLDVSPFAKEIDVLIELKSDPAKAEPLLEIRFKI